ncbi:hypothetical protein MCOR17_004114, partial [Pyricularia oryzae]
CQQRRLRAPKMGRNRIQGQAGQHRQLHEHTTQQRAGIYRSKARRRFGPNPNQVQQRTLGQERGNRRKWRRQNGVIWGRKAVL